MPNLKWQSRKTFVKSDSLSFRSSLYAEPARAARFYSTTEEKPLETSVVRRGGVYDVCSTASDSEKPLPAWVAIEAQSAYTLTHTCLFSLSLPGCQFSFDCLDFLCCSKDITCAWTRCRAMLLWFLCLDVNLAWIVSGCFPETIPAVQLLIKWRNQQVGKFSNFVSIKSGASSALPW